MNMMNQTSNNKNFNIKYVTTNTQTNQNFYNNLIKKNQIKYFPDKKNFYMSLKLNNKKRFSLSPRLNYIYNYNTNSYNINFDDNNHLKHKKINIDNFRIITSDNPNININHNTNLQNSTENLDFNHIYILKRINRIKDKINKNNFNYNYTQTYKKLPKIFDNSIRKNNNLYNSESIENKNKKSKFLNYIKKNDKNSNKNIKTIKNFNLDKDIIYQIKCLRRKEYNPKNI